MISVIICTFNRAQSLLRVLQSLEAMTIPPDLSWEVIVVDNNSRDETRETVANFAKTSRLNVGYVFEGNQGLNSARNRGVHEALGDILSFLDDDVVVAQDWLREVQTAFSTFPVVCVGGRVLLVQELPKPEWWDDAYDGALGKFDMGEMIFLPDESYTSIIGIGANLSFKRLTFDKYGLFRPDLDRRGRKLFMGGEVEFYERLKEGRERTMYYPQAVVYHCPGMERLTRQYLRRWYFRIGEWSVLRENSQAAEVVATVFGIPRWKYRVAMHHVLKAIGFALNLRHAEAFFYQLQCISFLGYFWGSMKHLSK